MTLMIDTNIILDVFLLREPFFTDSYRTLLYAVDHDIHSYLSATAITDIFYLLCKVLKDAVLAKTYISRLGMLLSIADVQSSDINTALSSDINDLEDAVVAAVAQRIKADFIITRDTKGFIASTVPSISPTEFMKQMESR